MRYALISEHALAGGAYIGGGYLPQGSCWNSGNGISLRKSVVPAGAEHISMVPEEVLFPVVGR